MTYSNDLIMKILKCIRDKKMNDSEIIDTFNISRGTFYSIKNAKGGSKRKTRKTKISRQVKNYIVKYVTTKKIFDHRKLKLRIHKRFNISISKSSIYNVLKSSKITRKKIYNKQILTCIDKRNDQIKLFKEQINNALNESSMDNIVSLDETSVDSHISASYGWSESGTKIENIIRHKRVRYTTILAVSCKKIIHKQIIMGSATGEIFFDFIKKLIKKLDDKKNNYVLLDNARIHHYKKIKEYIESKPRIKFIYNIPYTPQTNPIERVFSSVKHYLRKRNVNNNNIIDEINKSLKFVNSNILQKYFKKSLVEELNNL